MRSSLVILVALAACGGHAGATQPCFPAPGVSEYAARIYGVVLDAEGRAIPGVRVTARSESPVEHRMFQLRAVPPMPPRGPETVMFQGATDDLGRYRLMVQPAAYDVRFESDTLLFSWHHVTAAPGDQVRLDVDLGVVGPMPMRDRDASSEPHVSPRVAACGGGADAP